MKKILKWIFMITIVVIFAIDIAGFWKYKLKPYIQEFNKKEICAKVTELKV